MKIGVEIGTSSLKAAVLAPDGRPRPYPIPQSLQAAGPPTLDAVLSLVRDHPDSIEKTYGSVSSIVLAVPYQWIAEPHQLQLKYLETALYQRENLPLDYIYSNAVCSASYLQHAFSDVVLSVRTGPGSYNLLYCDLGGRDVEICLCQVSGQRVNVVGYAHSQGKGIQGGGEWFERRLAKQVQGKRISQWLVDDRLKVDPFVQQVKELRSRYQDRLTHQRLEAARDNQKWLYDIPIFHLDKGFTWNADQVWAAFQPVGKLISSLVGEVVEFAHTKPIRIDQVVIAGGFSLFPPARGAVWEAIDWCELGQSGMELDVLLTAEERQYAPVYGAALIANGVTVPREPFPHRIGLMTYREVVDQLLGNTPSLIEPGSIVPGRVQPVFYRDHTGRKKVLYVAEAGSQPVPVFIQIHGRGPEWKTDTPYIVYPPPGAYHIGVEIDSHNSGKLHFVPHEGGNEHPFVYELGRFIAHEKLEV